MPSKKPVKNSKKFIYTPTKTLTAIPDIKTTWDLKNLFYTSEKDPRIESDISTFEEAVTKFVKKYSSGTWTKSLKTIHTALKDYAALADLAGSRPLYYLSYRKEIDAKDTTAERLLNVYGDRLTKLENQILFFELTLAKLPKLQKKEILKSQEFAQFHFYLKSVFESAQFQLSEAEEKILNLKSLTSRSLWVAGTEKIISNKSIEWKGKPMPLNGALMEFEHLPYKERHSMWQKIVAVLDTVSDVAENELVALVLDKKISDELRGYRMPYSATTRAYDSTDETLERLVSVIETRGYALSKRFFALKKKILQKELTYIDRNESISKLPAFDFDTGVAICRDVFYDFDTSYGTFFDEMLTRGQIDVWPKEGKGGGAFCSSGTNQPTLVLLNHNTSFESVRTLAHEMGHAIHAFRSKSQPTLYQGHSILTAETASTFFESLVTEKLILQAPEEHKLEILNAFIADKIGTMIMCIARFKFELEMHTTIRAKGGMTAHEMASGLSKHFAEYTGKAITTTTDHGKIVFSKPHYRMNFYQYSYSFGEIGSSIMRKNFSADASYKTYVDNFLAQGDSASVETIFKSAGIDMSQESTFNQGLDILEELINDFERLAKKKKLSTR
jgi:oligoendopeptidase F